MHVYFQHRAAADNQHTVANLFQHTAQPLRIFFRQIRIRAFNKAFVAITELDILVDFFFHLRRNKATQIFNFFFRHFFAIQRHLKSLENDQQTGAARVNYTRFFEHRQQFRRLLQRHFTLG